MVLGPDGPSFTTDFAATSRPDEAVIGLRVGGICATDLELCRGYMGFAGALGHEWVGEVLSAPDARLVGKRVVGEINCPCGTCPTCLAGRPTHCASRTVLGIDARDGAFRERFELPTANLHVVPDNVSDEAAVFVEPLAAACQIVAQLHIKPTDRCIVIGVGRLGQLCARVLALTGAKVDAVSRRARLLDLLPSHIGQHLNESAAELAGADVVVDCTGSRDGMALATSLVRPRGTLVMKTTVHDPAGISPIPWIIDEVTLVGSRCGPFAPALRLLAAGLVDPTPLITAEFSLEDGVAALQAAASKAHVKVLLRP